MITVTGDVTIPSGVTLTIGPGTEVVFLANTDDTGGGNDPERSALIVEGTLDADAGGITFRSTNEPPNATDNDWYGIRCRKRWYSASFRCHDQGRIPLCAGPFNGHPRCGQRHPG